MNDREKNRASPSDMVFGVFMTGSQEKGVRKTIVRILDGQFLGIGRLRAEGTESKKKYTTSAGKGPETHRSSGNALSDKIRSRRAT